jgi:hypothetical protein
MREKRHMCTNIEGLLRNYKRKKINFITDDRGFTMSDKRARAEIAKLQALGHKLIPSGDCEGFDPFGGGCPGHPIEDDFETP